MKFVLEVDMDRFVDDADKELGRILRFWGGNMEHYDLKPGDGSMVNNSEYQPVGEWRIVEVPETSAAPGRE
ncbi:hypothetical protein FB566_5306 [Stackebrandtia endophytica]|uniref:Uncharacterized protein n=1 Tax=Stackebrandtia endophytica TaxID=1496996 RepID=A0A543B4E8_9ACTN|nr:hypothetical protein [Stackebrandtia endophytica]TQL79694.1 hypothetical protein FB566_5306 [Stackebrandtia endophytica]